MYVNKISNTGEISRYIYKYFMSDKDLRLFCNTPLHCIV